MDKNVDFSSFSAVAEVQDNIPILFWYNVRLNLEEAYRYVVVYCLAPRLKLIVGEIEVLV